VPAVPDGALKLQLKAPLLPVVAPSLPFLRRELEGLVRRFGIPIS